VKVPYIKERSEYGGWDYTELRPTGRWMIVSGPYCKNHLFIQHRAFLFFRFWVSEDDIVFKRAYSSAVFGCGA